VALNALDAGRIRLCANGVVANVAQSPGNPNEFARMKHKYVMYQLLSSWRSGRNCQLTLSEFAAIILLDREALRNNHQIDSSPENSAPPTPRAFGSLGSASLGARSASPAWVSMLMARICWYNQAPVGST
jgi:hypothetical protein